jgi:hypothetical protein
VNPPHFYTSHEEIQKTLHYWGSKHPLSSVGAHERTMVSTPAALTTQADAMPSVAGPGLHTASSKFVVITYDGPGGCD